MAVILTLAMSSCGKPEMAPQRNNHVDKMVDLPTSPVPTSPVGCFYLPPPEASAIAVIPRDFLVPKGKSCTLAEMNKTLCRALERAGYTGNSYHTTVPRGFALVTRIERMREDGSLVEGPARWDMQAGPMEGFSIRNYLRVLSSAKAGYYRVIVFVVTDVDFGKTNATARQADAETWWRCGSSTLPVQVGAMSYTEDYNCTVLIYQFSKEKTKEFVILDMPSHMLGQDHLIRNGVWAYLEGT